MTGTQHLKPFRNATYLKHVRKLHCAGCDEQYEPREAAHVRMGNGGGMGLKPSDYRTVPLCHACHSYQHQLGERSFWERLERDPDYVIILALAAYVADRRGLIETLEHIVEGERGRPAAN